MCVRGRRGEGGRSTRRSPGIMHPYFPVPRREPVRTSAAQPCTWVRAGNAVPAAARHIFSLNLVLQRALVFARSLRFPFYSHVSWRAGRPLMGVTGCECSSDGPGAVEDACSRKEISGVSAKCNRALSWPHSLALPRAMRHFVRWGGGACSPVPGERAASCWSLSESLPGTV